MAVGKNKRGKLPFCIKRGPFVILKLIHVFYCYDHYVLDGQVAGSNIDSCWANLNICHFGVSGRAVPDYVGYVGRPSFDDGCLDLHFGLASLPR